MKSGYREIALNTICVKDPRAKSFYQREKARQDKCRKIEKELKRKGYCV